MPLDPNNPFSDLVPKGSPGVIQGPPKIPDVPNGYEPDPTQPGALRPITGGPQDPNANDTLDDQTTTFYAQQVLSGAAMPAMGMGKVASQNRQKVMKKVAEIAGAQGLSGSDLAKQIAHYQAGKKQLGTLEQQLGTTRQNEATALLNGQQFIDRSTELPGQTEYPALNAITQFIQKNVPVPGHDTKVAMDAAYQTFTNEYAKVVSGSPSGAGTLSDSARHEAMAVLTGNYSLTQKKAVFDQMKADMENRMIAMKSGINQGYDALVKQPGYEVPDSTTALPVGQTKQQDHIVIPGVTSAGNGGSGGSGGGDTPPGMTDLSDDQKRAYTAFIASHNGKPDPGSLKVFLEGLTGKSVTNADQIAAAIASGKGFSSAVEDLTYKGKVNQRIAGENKLGIGANPTETLLMQGGTLNLSDEAAGVGNALSNVVTSPFTGKFDPVGSYKFGRDVERQRIANAREQLGYGGTALEVAGALGSGNASAAMAEITPRAAALTAAGGSAIAGFGAGEGTKGSLTGAGVGALTGYAVGRAAPMIADRLARGGRGLAPDLAAASEAENVDLIRPMVDPQSRARFGALESDSTAQPIVRAGAENVRNQIEGRVADLGDGGTALDTEAAGLIPQRGGNRFIQRTRGVKNALYNRAESLAGDTRFVPQQAIEAIEQHVAQLRGAPETNAAQIAFLEGVHTDLATPGGKTVAEIRNIREGLRGSIGAQNLTMSDAERRALDVLNTARQDIAANVPAAAAAYNRADAYYAARQTHIDDIIKRITGGRIGQQDFQVSGEQAFARLKAMASPGGDGRRLAALMRDLEPSERQDIAASIAQGLGRDAPDQPFSVAKFISQTNKLSPSARRTIFGPDGAQSIDNLRTLSQALKDAGGDINRSRSTTVSNRMSPLKAAARGVVMGLTGLGGYSAGGIGGALGTATAAAGAMGVNAGMKALSARAMVNPRVSRWLAQAVDVGTPTQAQAAVRRLGLIISREPAVAAELKPVYEFLQQRVSTPLAAEPQAQSGNQEQQ